MGGGKVAVGNFNYSSSSKVSINIGFKPKYLCIRAAANETSVGTAYIYDERFSTTNMLRTSTGAYLQSAALGGSTDGRLYSINSDGFTMNKVSTSLLGSYFAIG